MQGTLLIKVLKATLQINTDWFKKMDPLVEVKLNDQTSKTTYKSNAGKTPEWNETLSFRAKEGDSVLFTVFDADLFKQDLVGSGAFQIADIYNNNHTEKTIKLYYESNKYAGDLYIELHFFPHPKEYSKLTVMLRDDITNKVKLIDELHKELKMTNKLEKFDEEQKKRTNEIKDALFHADRKENIESEFQTLRDFYDLKIQETEKDLQRTAEEISYYNQSIEKSKKNHQSCR